MRIETLMSAAEAAGYAMAVPADVLAAEERELAAFAQKNRLALSGEPAADTATSGYLRKLISDRGSAWMPEWLKRGAPA